MEGGGGRKVTLRTRSPLQLGGGSLLLADFCVYELLTSLLIRQKIHTSTYIQQVIVSFLHIEIMMRLKGTVAPV